MNNNNNNQSKGGEEVDANKSVSAGLVAELLGGTIFSQRKRSYNICATENWRDRRCYFSC
ncbi:MAG TPA: hypothetical protein VH415_03140 [Nitrososphaeraceae archaeon]|jgi:hypothetical protein